MPSLAKFMIEILNDANYAVDSAEYTAQLESRVNTLNHAQLKGLHNLLKSSSETADSKLWKRANSELLITVGKILKIRDDEIAEDKRLDEEVKEIKRKKREAKRGKREEQARVQQFLRNKAREEAEKEIYEQEIRREGHERAEMLEKEPAALRERLKYGIIGVFFLGLGIAIVVVTASKQPIILGVLIGVIILMSAVIFWHAYKVGLVLPVVMTKADIDRQIDEREEELLQAALATQAEKERLFRLREQLDKEQRKAAREKKREQRRLALEAFNQEHDDDYYDDDEYFDDERDSASFESKSASVHSNAISVLDAGDGSPLPPAPDRNFRKHDSMRMDIESVGSVGPEVEDNSSRKVDIRPLRAPESPRFQLLPYSELGSRRRGSQGQSTVQGTALHITVLQIRCFGLKDASTIGYMVNGRITMNPYLHIGISHVLGPGTADPDHASVSRLVKTDTQWKVDSDDVSWRFLPPKGGLLGTDTSKYNSKTGNNQNRRRSSQKNGIAAILDDRKRSSSGAVVPIDSTVLTDRCGEAGGSNDVRHDGIGGTGYNGLDSDMFEDEVLFVNVFDQDRDSALGIGGGEGRRGSANKNVGALLADPLLGSVELSASELVRCDIAPDGCVRIQKNLARNGVVKEMYVQAVIRMTRIAAMPKSGSDYVNAV